MNLKQCLVGLVMLGASIGAAFAVDLVSAQAAYDKGDFEEAFKQFLSLAEAGNGLAQSSTGVTENECRRRRRATADSPTRHAILTGGEGVPGNRTSARLGQHQFRR